MCTGSASVIWRWALHPPQPRRLFAPGSHLTGEQLLALVLALFIRHRLTAGHPDLTATGALDFTTWGQRDTARKGADTRAPTWILSVLRDSLATKFLCAIRASKHFGEGFESGDQAAVWACGDRLL